MSKLQSVPTAGEDNNKLVIKEWKFDEDYVILGIWGIAKALEQQLVQDNPDETSQCLSIALVNLATQLKESL